MKKLHAHLVLAGFDVAAAFAALYVIATKSKLFAMVESSAGEISYQSGFTYCLLLLVIPIVHGWSFFETAVPVRAKIKQWVNHGLVLVFLLLLFLAWAQGQQIENHLNTHHYIYCPEKSQSFTFSEFRMYLKEPRSCKNDY